MGAFVISPLPPLLSEELQAAGSLRSTGVTPLPRYYEPHRHPLVFDRLPGVSGYTAYLAAANFSAGRGGLLQLRDASCVTVLSLPPRRSDEPSQPGYGPSCCLRLSVAGSTSGNLAFSGPHPCSLALRPGDLLPSRRWPCRWASEIRFPSSLPSELQGSGFYLGGSDSRRTRPPSLDAQPDRRIYRIRLSSGIMRFAHGTPWQPRAAGNRTCGSGTASALRRAVRSVDRRAC